jgi:hypothetical protein
VLASIHAAAKLGAIEFDVWRMGDFAATQLLGADGATALSNRHEVSQN